MGDLVVVAHQAATVLQSIEGAFYHPAFWKSVETRRWQALEYSPGLNQPVTFSRHVHTQALKLLDIEAAVVSQLEQAWTEAKAWTGSFWHLAVPGTGPV